MYISLTGTPGTGKTSVSRILYKNNVEILNLNKIIKKKEFKFEFDKNRKTKIVEIEKINEYIKENIKNHKLLIIEGHLSHLLSCIDKVILLRCHPKELKERLLKRRWNKKKIIENIESEILDIILCESVSIHSSKNIFEIDTTGKSIKTIAFSILNIINDNFNKKEIYKIGNIDWSEEILNLKVI